MSLTTRASIFISVTADAGMVHGVIGLPIIG
jgi:hypothetical protein